MTRVQGLLALLICLVVSSAPSAAQRGQGGQNWELLGRQSVGFSLGGSDTDSIRIGDNEDMYRGRAFAALRFAAAGNDVHLIRIRVIYLNGYAEELDVNQVIRRGGSLVVDLRGERSFLRQIDMTYRSNFGISINAGNISLQKATVSVFGDQIGGGAGPGLLPRPDGGWVEVDRRPVSLADERVVLGGREGLYGQLRVRNGGTPIDVSSLIVRYGNGEQERFEINQRVLRGETTGPIDLAGAQRFVDAVTVVVDPRRRSGATLLALEGTPRPGDQSTQRARDIYVERGWVLLGQKSVDFSLERDVISVDRGDDFYRDRRFRRLHIVVERYAVQISDVRVVYMNGYAEDFRLYRPIAAGSEATIDLRAERSFVRDVEIGYRGRIGVRAPATVKVYGER
jgi:hypothetical protein